jgi:superfamily II DNA or RNA helicase
MSEFVLYYLNKLKEIHPMFRYPLLTGGDYEPYVHQSEIFYRVLSRHPVRFLIADDVGLGKTIEGIMIIDQLIKLRGVKRILLIVPRVLVNQWIYELRRFTKEWNLSVFEYNPALPLNENGIYVVSVDTLKRKNHRERFLSLPWDLIVVDEIHKIGIIGNKENQRYEALSSLVSRNPNIHFIGLSATPHKGNDNDYIKRLELIDPYLRDVNDQILRSTVRAIILKRNKDNVNKVYEREDIFPKAYFIQYLAEPTEDEKKYYTLIRELSLSILKEYYNTVGKQPKALQLLAFNIGRRSLSSPWAGLKTFEHIIENRRSIVNEEEVIDEAEEYAEEEDTEESVEPDDIANKLAEINEPFLRRFKDFIPSLIESAKRVMENDTRIKSLINLVKIHLDRGDKIIVFTEYKDTANYIESKLKESLNLSDNEIKIASSETVSKEGIDSIKRWLEGKGRKILVATDVASEGLNLQSANVLIHYEIPLSIVKFEQRNGRVWRLKQLKPVYIYYISLKIDLEQALLENYYNKLLSITKGTGSNDKVVDALIYQGATVNRVFDLSEDKENIPIYMTYNDPKNEKEQVTPIKVWEAALQGNLDNLVETLLKRIKILKDTMKRFALFEKMQGAILNEINVVRLISGFENRRELKESIKSFLGEFAKHEGGTFNGNLINIPSKQFIENYDENRIGKDIYLLYSLISRYAKDGNKRFVVSNSLDYNVYLIEAEIESKDRNILIKIPLILNSKGDIIQEKDFIKSIIPQLFSGNIIYAAEVNLSDDSWKYKGINYVQEKLYSLEQQFVSYRKNRGKDNWIPNNREDFKVNIELIGAIIGVKGHNEEVRNNVISVLQKQGWKVTLGDKIRIEKPGEVRYINVVKPLEIFNSKDSSWVYTYVNNALIGVKNGV